MVKFWYQITDWFGELRERRSVIKDFNAAAKNSFINGVAPTLIQAKVTRGTFEFRHAFSKFMAGGFRITALSGGSLEKKELIEIGKIILANDVFVRKLISLGWDTLEVHGQNDNYGLKWSFKKYGNFGGVLTQ